MVDDTVMERLRVTHLCSQAVSGHGRYSSDNTLMTPVLITFAFLQQEIEYKAQEGHNALESDEYYGENTAVMEMWGRSQTAVSRRAV